MLPVNPPGVALEERVEDIIASLLKSSPAVNPSAPDQSSAHVWASAPSKCNNNLAWASPCQIPFWGVNGIVWWRLVLDTLNSSMNPVKLLVPA